MPPCLILGNRWNLITMTFTNTLHMRVDNPCISGAEEGAGRRGRWRRGDRGIRDATTYCSLRRKTTGVMMCASEWNCSDVIIRTETATHKQNISPYIRVNVRNSIFTRKCPRVDLVSVYISRIMLVENARHSILRLFC